MKMNLLKLKHEKTGLFYSKTAGAFTATEAGGTLLNHIERAVVVAQFAGPIRHVAPNSIEFTAELTRRFHGTNPDKLRTALVDLSATALAELRQFENNFMSNPLSAFQWSDAAMTQAVVLAILSEVFEMWGESLEDGKLATEVFKIVQKLQGRLLGNEFPTGTKGDIERSATALFISKMWGVA